MRKAEAKVQTVYVGPFSDRSSASSASSDLSKRLGLNGFVVIKSEL